MRVRRLSRYLRRDREGCGGSQEFSSGAHGGLKANSQEPVYYEPPKGRGPVRQLSRATGRLQRTQEIQDVLLLRRGQTVERSDHIACLR
jgi:hypothetical protein